MYFTSIDINNYGSVSDFHYKFRFGKDGHPIPLVLIGENGTGKTLTIANMVDALIEIKRKTYGENLNEVKKHNFYKIGSKDYISMGKNSSRVCIALKHKEEVIKYTDIMSNNPDKVTEDGFISKEDIDKNPLFTDNGFLKTVSGALKQKDYSEFISLFFPVDRFYVPLWYNDENYKRVDYSGRTSINYPTTNLIKVDILANIKEWLARVYSQTIFQLVQVENLPNSLNGSSGGQLKARIDSNIQRTIKKAMNTISGTNDYHPRTTDRRSQTVAFTMSGIACNDISQLSEGQISLFAIALSIIKEWDVDHDGFELSEIKGCVIIDEADIGMHINYMYDCFPRMMQLFPNVQFILTTHSPFMVAGLTKAYGEDIDVITMPEGVKITDINSFSEVQKAQEMVCESIKKIRDEDKMLKEEVAILRQSREKIMIYTEGKTDEILLKKAVEKLGITDIPLEIRAASQNQGKHCDDAIKKLLCMLQENPCIINTVIGLFDRDAKPPIEFIDVEGNKVKLVEQDYVKLGDHLFAFALPIPHNRLDSEHISIEHYFTDEEIKTENESHQRLFLGNEFYPTGIHKDSSKDYFYCKSANYHDTIRIIEHEQGAYVTNQKGEGDFSLSKAHFAEAVSHDRTGFDNFDFSEFDKIFCIIRKISDVEHNK